ncbi:SusC/RagA family TonB-linked outer membrane protein [Rufibacter immobilis]|uniref:SusC/RagA family TonB-linked outer membrane protein n=1 Tax=Rufibacter immobilis TaxID=1348778 RepID=A0A3M9N683_9BACT|nr:SusC/RagA family TonB-linked outer membrane protein [Rufibacter immobilis]RNI32895.1 SusC/RagA family TonB-linked outer membrane protein [Rufibacter immobilis]
MKKILLLSLLLLSVFLNEAMAQTKTITGRVTDATTGEGMPGVTVQLKGTSTAAPTDVNGGYSIAVPTTGGTLVFSFIGYTNQEIAIGNQTTINARLATDARALGEVVVTALGIERQKKEVGYAATTVTEEVITRAAPVNVATGLQGKVSGLNITTTNSGVFENVKINLRGIRSLTGNNNPLLLLDGVPSDINYLSSLNPNDIDNVTVLKGSSGAALYGPDARNGVIVVTTKKGSLDEKPVITLSHSTQLTQISFFPKFQEKFGSGGGGEYIPYENWSWGPEFDGSEVLLGDPLANGNEQRVAYSARNDRKKFFDTGVTTQNNVSLAIKDFYISLQDAVVKGIVPDDKNRRTGIRLNTGREYGRVKVGLNTNYIQQNYNVFDDASMASWNSSNNVGLNQGLMNLIFNTPAHAPLLNYKDFENNEFATYNNYFNHYGINPYFALDNWRRDGKREDLITNLDLSFKATDWLSLNYRAALTSQNISERTTSKGENPNSFGSPRGVKTIPGTVSERSFRNIRLSSEAFANINKEINEDFKINAVVGTYVRQDQARDTRVGATQLVVPELFNISNRVGQLTGSSPERTSRLFSLYGSVGLSYRGWANLEVTGRNDQTSVLAIGNNSFFYPGVSGSLVLTDAIGALQDNNILSYLKLRGSWNQTGNADIAPYLLAATFGQPAGFPFGSLPGFTANNTTYDANLKPEFIESREIGIETGFLDGRINIEATYYNQDMDDQIIDVDVSSATGYTKAYVNAASFINKGVELDLRITPLVELGDVKIDFRANATYNTTEVTKIFEGLDQLPIGGYTTAANYAIKGYPAFVFRATDYNRDPEGRVIVDASTGMPTQNPATQIFGRTMPTWIMGFNPSVSWKGINLSVLAEYKTGHYAYHDIGNAMAWTGVSEATASNSRQNFVFPNSVILGADGNYVPNTNVTINGAENFYTGIYRTVASNFITSAASWRLREVALSYELPSSLISRQKVVKGVSVALTGRNLFLWLPKTNVYSDPDFTYSPGETNFGTGNSTGVTSGNQAGITNSTINPPVRTFGGSVTLTF